MSRKPTQILRLFWLAAAAVLLAGLFGLLSGWTSSRQWSDGLFIAGTALMITGGAALWGTPLDTAGPLWLRVLSRHNTTVSTQQYFSDLLEKQTFGMQAVAGGLLTMLLAVVVSLL